MTDGYKLEHMYDEAGRFYGVRIEQEVVQLTREEFKIVCARISVLRRENAKLRERIKELEQCIRGDAEGIYKLAKITGYLHTDELMKSVNNRMRELGVEV